MISVIISALNADIFGKVTVTILATLIALAVYYKDRAIFHEHRKNVLNYPGYPLVGNLPILLKHKNRILDYFLEVYHQYNTLTWTFSILGLPRHICTLNPCNVEYVLKGNFEGYVKGPDFHNAMNDLFGNGTVNVDGDEWKNHRKNAVRIFNVNNFRDHCTDVFVERIHYMMDNIWDKAVERQSIVDFQDIMKKFTLDSSVYIGLGVHLNTLGSKDQVPFAVSFDEAQHLTFQRFTTPMYPVVEFLGHLAQPWKPTMASHIKVLDEFVYKVVKQRRKQLLQDTHKDLLSRKLNITKDDGKLKMDVELRDDMFNFFAAGRDTVAQALCWTFYMIMSHPLVEAKLLDEINANISKDALNDVGRLHETIKVMKYAHAVFYEVLRLYPSVPTNIKMATQDDIFPDGTIIKKGDNIVLCPYAQGRVEDIWGPDANQFKPERWFTEAGNLKRESQGKWPAFNGGPRTCLGQHLATLETLAVIIFILRRYKFTMVPDQDITYQMSLTLPMKNGMKVTVEKR